MRFGWKKMVTPRYVSLNSMELQAGVFKDGNSFDGLNLNTAKITGKPSAAAYLNKLIVAWSETNSLGVPQIRVAKSPF